MNNQQFECLRCIKRVDQTADSSTFEFEHLDQRPFLFQAGQFLTFEINYYNNLLYRAYSICSSPNSRNSVTIAIKRVPGGKISNYLLDNLQSGHALPAMAPAGQFTQQNNKTTEQLLLMSAGSGITPCLAIAQDSLERQPNKQVHFIHSARSSDDVIMLPLLKALAEKHDNFQLSLILKEIDLQASNDQHYFKGRLDKDLFAQLIPEHKDHTIFICGPSLYMQSVEQFALAAGFDMDYFHKESFVPESNNGETFSDTNHQITIPATDKQFMVNDQQNILDAMLDAGIKVPYSCKAGICGACKCKVSGDVISSSNEALTNEQIEQGYILTCSSKANSDLIIEL